MMKVFHYVRDDGKYIGSAMIPEGADLDTCYNPHRDAGCKQVPGGAESSYHHWDFKTKKWYLPASEEREREWRDAQLSESLWMRNRHRDQVEIGVSTTLTTEQFLELLSYQQALRDWPQSDKFPDSAFRPAAPSWYAAE